MRLHRLEVEAFGPFARPTTIDFDEVGATGLFLIHGPTGSGKTSLLDAVCFALFSDVPGTRSRRGLRSDHADPDAVPRVGLEFTAAGRRFRLTRSPEFERPKKRGEGRIRVPTKVALEERLGGAWSALSSRADEVALVVDEVLGLGLDQFAKVVVLPQGDFTAFLRANAEERRAVLEKLFDIGVFRDVEEWFAAERRATTAEVSGLTGLLGTHLALLDDVVGTRADAVVDDPVAAAGPMAPLDHSRATADPQAGLDHPATDLLVDGALDQVPTRLAHLRETLDADVSEMLAAFEEADGRQRVAHAALEAGRRVAGAREKGRAATERLAVLDSHRAAHQARLDEITAAHRASRLHKELAACTMRREQAASASGAAQAAQRVAAHTGVGHVGIDALADVVAAVAARDGIVTELAASAQGLRLARSREATLCLDADRSREVARLREAEVEHLHESLAGIDLEIDALAVSAADADVLRMRAEQLRVRLELRRGLEEDAAALAEIKPLVLAAHEAALETRETVVALRTLRLAGMAAELADALVDGGDCPVCGSREHPRPATSDSRVAPTEIEDAESELERRTEALQALRETEASITTRQGERRSLLGGEPAIEAIETDLATTTALLTAAEQAAVGLIDGRARQTAMRSRLEEAGLAAEQARIDAGRADALVGTVRADVESTTTTLTRHLAEHATCPCADTLAPPTTPVDSLDDVLALVTRHRRWAADLTALHATRAEVVRADHRSRDAEEVLLRALGEVGFADETAATTAMRDPETLEVLQAGVRSHENEHAAVRAVLDDPEIRDALVGAPPDLGALTTAERHAREAMHTARSNHAAAAQRLTMVTRIIPEVTGLCSRLVQATERADRVRELADTVTGTGSDNTLRMRLTSFVLAARLERVVALANERLGALGSGRYILEHTDERASGGARSGLGLRVLDQWTGVARETSSLSGGESFMASLALALGLADAVREESGGADLGTLFVDEGFGTLDEESLEEVLTVLDSLREGGRAVGVVSHVGDLRNRITHQVAVTKDPAGSRARVEVSGAAVA